MTLRVALAEDNLLLREGMRGLIDGREDMRVVAVCGDLVTLLAAVDGLTPDVVLTDIRMPPSRTDEGIRAAEYCRVHHPRTGVLLLSQYVDARYIRTLINDGADARGYLLKERIAAIDDLLAAIRAVADGGSAFDPKVIETLVQNGSRRGDVDLSALSAREREVLAEMAQGRNNAAIAQALVITQRAVEKHINSIFAKLRVGQDDEAHPRVRAVLTYLLGGVP